MLNQLEEVSAPHPPHILERLMPLLPAYGDLSLDENFTKLTDDVCKMVELNPVPWTGVALDRSLIISKCTSRTLPEITRIVYELKAEADEAHVWICKSMANVHYVNELEQYPVPPLYIHLYRDGRDVALSFKKAIVGEKHSYYLAKQWKKEQDAALALFENLGEKRVLQVRYENLLVNPSQELQRICDFLGIQYSNDALNYHQSHESRETANSGLMWQNVVKPVLADNQQKFLKELSEEDIRIFERVAGDTLVKLDYKLVYREDHSPFSESEIADFLEINTTSKAEFRSKLRPEDLAKRKGQEELLKSISSRMPQ